MLLLLFNTGAAAAPAPFLSADNVVRDASTASASASPDRTTVVAAVVLADVDVEANVEAVAVLSITHAASRLPLLLLLVRTLLSQSHFNASFTAATWAASSAAAVLITLVEGSAALQTVATPPDSSNSNLAEFDVEDDDRVGDVGLLKCDAIQLESRTSD